MRQFVLDSFQNTYLVTLKQPLLLDVLKGSYSLVTFWGTSVEPPPVCRGTSLPGILRDGSLASFT